MVSRQEAWERSKLGILPLFSLSQPAGFHKIQPEILSVKSFTLIVSLKVLRKLAARREGRQEGLDLKE